MSTVRFSAAVARTFAGQGVTIDAAPAGAGKLAYTMPVPVGVVAAITPFNFPLNLVAHKLAPAIAAGCPVVLKPAPQAPLTALAFAQVLLDAGLPGDFLSVVPGSPEEIGAALTGDDRVAAITFTGSTRVGWLLRQQAPRKKVLLELGNSAPAIVHADADLEIGRGQAHRRRFRVRRAELRVRAASLRPPRNRGRAQQPDGGPHARPGRRRSGRRESDRRARHRRSRPAADHVLDRARQSMPAPDSWPEAQRRSASSRPRCSPRSLLDSPLEREEAFGPVFGISAYDDRRDRIQQGQRHQVRAAGFDLHV